jgi:hypothetical protein
MYPISDDIFFFFFGGGVFWAVNFFICETNTTSHRCLFYFPCTVPRMQVVSDLSILLKHLSKCEIKTTLLVVLLLFSFNDFCMYICTEYFVWDPASVQNLYEVKTGCEHYGAHTSINHAVILLMLLHNPRYIEMKRYRCYH